MLYEECVYYEWQSNCIMDFIQPVIHSPPGLHSRAPTERLPSEVPRAADFLRADHHRPGRAWLHRVGLPSGGRGPQAQEQPVQGETT